VEIPKIGKLWQLQKDHTLGYTVAILSAILAALMHVVPKPLLESSNDLVLNPITLACVIYLMNGLFFTPFTKHSTPISKIGRKNLIFLILIGCAEMTGLIMYFFGLKDATAAHSAILNSSEIIFAMIIAMTFLRERLKKNEWYPFSIIITGLFVLPLGFDFFNSGMVFSSFVIGDFLVFFAGIFFAIDINISKYVSDRLESKQITQISSFVAGIIALVIIFILQIPFEISYSHIPGIITSGIIGTGISTLFFVMALRYIGAVRTTLIYSTSPVFGISFAFLFLHENITMINIISLILVVTGVFLLKDRIAKT
jgi:drug/metabolite transporter (DMT)-like permease